ncbi:MAG TPA: bifunctional serine/threonine-protein kinase/formylglycine-generating enzyme family protein [Planctomycetota bacterium]|nr:bifunctional serine/threonine-protein kinase/formylglycine-generating enzyme family protein [Planctomycetota bacterium]
MSSSSGLFGQKFQIQKKLGEGGMGAVYKALDVKLNRLVAIKVLQASVAGNEMFKSRFQKEARSQAKFNHPNIVLLYDSDFTSEGQPYMVMEFIEGMPLDEFLRQNGALPLDRLMALFSQICSGVAVAHHEQVIHRDLKPANLMLTKDATGQEVIKILDLGLAKMVEAATGQDEPQTQKTMGATQAGMVLGTPQYMSPEQATGGDVDCRTDVYALGMILCEMTTGKLPYNATSAMQWIAKQISEVPQPPSKIRPDLKLPKALDTVFNKAVSKEASERYATAQDMYQDLVHQLAEEGYSYGQGKSSIVIIKQKSNAGLVLLLILMLLVLGGAAVGGYFWWTAKRHQNFQTNFDQAKALRDNAFTDKGIKLEGLANALKSYETAGKYADSADERQLLEQYLPIANEVQEIAKNERDGDLRQAWTRLDNLKTSKSAWVDMPRVGAEIDRLAKQLKALDEEFDQKFNGVRTAAYESLKSAKAADIPTHLDQICNTSLILVPGTGKAGFDQAKTNLLSLYNTQSSTAQTMQQSVDDLVKKIDSRRAPAGELNDQQRVRQLLIELMLLRFNELADLKKVDATKASKAKQLDKVKESAQAAIEIYKQTQQLAAAAGDSPSRTKLLDDASTGIANCDVLIQRPDIADLLEQFLNARKASQDAMDAEKWGEAATHWKDSSTLADQLASSKITPEDLRRLMALPKNTEFTGEMLRKTAQHCAELEIYQKRYEEAIQLAGQARQDARVIGDALKALEAAVNKYNSIEGQPMPRNKAELDKQFTQAKERLGQIFTENMLLGKTKYDQKNYNDALKAYTVAQDLGKLFAKGDEPPDLATLADKITDARQKVIFESGITKLQSSLIEIDKDLKNIDPDAAQVELANAAKYKDAVEKAGFAGTIQDEMNKLAAVPAVIAGQKTYLEAMAGVKTASVAGQENWSAMVKGFRAARDAQRKLPTEYQPRVDLDDKIKSTVATVKNEYAKQEEASLALLKTLDYSGALDGLVKLKQLGEVLEGNDVPESFAALQIRIDRCLRYKNPPALDLGNNVKMEFVYVESPRGNFYIGKTEVTNIQFESIDKKHFVKRPDFQKQNGDTHPVVKISYNECRDYCAALSKLAAAQNPKFTVRMPTESEWIDGAVYKPDSGLDPSKGSFLIYPWGKENPDPPKKNYLNYSGMEAEDFTDNEDRYKLDGFLKTAPVGSFPQDLSPAGCLDMGGNVQEWTALDDAKAEAGNASQKRICKGGSYHHCAQASKARPEGDNFIDEQFVDAANNDYIGFRVVLDIGETKK